MWKTQVKMQSRFWVARFMKIKFPKGFVDQRRIFFATISLSNVKKTVQFFNSILQSSFVKSLQIKNITWGKHLIRFLANQKFYIWPIYLLLLLSMSRGMSLVFWVYVWGTCPCANPCKVYHHHTLFFLLFETTLHTNKQLHIAKKSRKRASSEQLVPMKIHNNVRQKKRRENNAVGKLNSKWEKETKVHTNSNMWHWHFCIQPKAIIINKFYQDLN